MRRGLSRSASKKLAVMLLACAGFVLLYEATTFDSREVTDSTAFNPAALVAGQQLIFTATAYCKGTTTAAGTSVRSGVAASDPTLLPVGSVVSVTTDDARYNGVYTIMDTGPKVQGRTLDLYMWSCNEALKFGRKQVQVQVLRLGWSPAASSPSLIDRLFRRREAARRAAPPAPPPVTATEPAPAPAVTPEGANLEPDAGYADPAPDGEPAAPVPEVSD